MVDDTLRATGNGTTAETATLCVNGTVVEAAPPEPGVVSSPEIISVSLEAIGAVCVANARLTDADPPAAMVDGGLTTLNGDPDPDANTNWRLEMLPAPGSFSVTLRVPGVPIVTFPKPSAVTLAELTENVSGASADAVPVAANVCVNATELSVPVTVSVSE